MAANDEESAPLIQGRSAEPLDPQPSMISVFSNSDVEHPAGDDDVALVTKEESERYDPRRKSTLILDAKVEEELDRFPAGRAVLRDLATSILGQLFQVLLLVGCLGVYTFTPEIISMSKETNRGLTGLVEASDDPLAGPPLTRIDREMALTAENWPDVRKAGWERITITWTGFVEIPDEEPAGKYSFELHLGEASQTGTVKIDDAEMSIQPLKLCDDVSSDRIFCVVKSPSSPIPSIPIKVIAESLPATASANDFVSLVYKMESLDEMSHAKEVPGWWLRINEKGQLERSVAGVKEGQRTVKGVKPYKSQPYLDASVVVVNRLLCVLITAGIAFGTGGLTKLKACFDAKNIALFAPCAVCYAIADIAEILANGAMDPTVYIILSQSRLLLTALTLKLWMGTSQNTLQWIDLTVLTLLVVIFQFIPSTFETAGPKTQVFPDPGGSGVKGIGQPCALVKIMMSVVAGVYSQKLYQGDPMPFEVQLCNLSVTGTICAIIVLPISCMLTGSLDVLMKNGLFSGADYPFKWDRRVVAVIGVYQAREWITNIVVKKFDAVMKNLCNSGAALVSFLFGIFILKKPGGLFIEKDGKTIINEACAAKFCAILGVCMLVTSYSLGKSYVKVTASKKG